MKSEISDLKKSEIVWLAEHKCKHNHSFLEHIRCYQKKPKEKVLYIDIETSPSLGWVYGKYEQTVLKFEKEWHIMCIGYKWSDGKFQILYGDEKKILAKIRELLDEADVVSWHNGNKFDLKKIRTRIEFYKLGTFSGFKSIDTLLHCRRLFGLNSNKLDDVGEYFGFGRKKGSYANLWEDCLNGDKKAWKSMIAYNKQDVLLLEKLHKQILAKWL